MKLYTVLLLVFTISAFAQPRFEKVRGHYDQLNAYSSAGKPGAAIDTLRFPYDAAAANRRLSLKPIFLTNTALADFTLPEVPANSSDLTRAELNYLLGLQQQRTELDVETSLTMAGIYYNPRIKPEDSLYTTYRRNLFFIGRSIGTWFNPDNLPKTADLMARIWQDASYFIWAFKYQYARVRPYVLEPLLNNLEETNWAAYPSGHAANSYINAYIYSALAPQFSDVFLKDAYDMAHSREIIGVHYPTDSESSRLLAQQLVAKLFANPEFKAEFEQVKQEWNQKAKETFMKPEVVKENLAKPESCAKKCE